MVRKVVIPATISVRTVVLFSSSLKSRSSIVISPVVQRVCGFGLCKTSHGQNKRGRQEPKGGREGLGLPLEGPFPTVRGHPPEAPRGPLQHAHEPIFSADL